MTETPKPRRPRAKAAAEPERQGRVRKLADMVPAVGATSFRRFGFVQSSIVSRWAEIVGPRYARVSTPESIRFPAGKRQDGTLSLMVEGSHATMMQHIAPVVIERVNQFFGYPAVARLAIRQGAAEPRRPVPPVRPADTAVPAALGDSLKAIADPELRTVLESLARGLAADAPVVPLKLGRIG